MRIILGPAIIVGTLSVLSITLLPLAPSAMAQNVPRAIENLDDSALAADVPLERRRQARELFLEGTSLLKETLFAQAEAKYLVALEHWDLPAIHYNLAIAQFNLAQNKKAYESIRRALSHGVAALGMDKHQEARNLEKLIRSQLAQLTVACEEPRAKVVLDGQLLLTGPGREDILLEAGAHQIVAKKPGYETTTMEVSISPSKDDVVNVELQPNNIVTVRRWSGWLPLAVLGGGLLMTAGGGYLDWRSTQQFDEADIAFAIHCRHYGCHRTEIPDVIATVQRAERNQDMARLGYVLGAGVLATGFVMLYFNRETSIRVPGNRDEGSTVNVSVTTRHVSVEARFSF